MKTRWCGGVGLPVRIDSKKLIDFSRRSKWQKREKRGRLIRNRYTGFLALLQRCFSAKLFLEVAIHVAMSVRNDSEKGVRGVIRTIVRNR